MTEINYEFQQFLVNRTEEIGSFLAKGHKNAFLLEKVAPSEDYFVLANGTETKNVVVNENENKLLSEDYLTKCMNAKVESSYFGVNANYFKYILDSITPTFIKKLIDPSFSYFSSTVLSKEEFLSEAANKCMAESFALSAADAVVSKEDGLAYLFGAMFLSLDLQDGIKSVYPNATIEEFIPFLPKDSKYVAMNKILCEGIMDKFTGIEHNEPTSCSVYEETPNAYDIYKDSISSNNDLFNLLTLLEDSSATLVHSEI